MSSTKIHVMITDHGTENLGKSTLAGLIREGFRFSGFILGNPDVKANGMSEADVVKKIVDALLTGSTVGSRKIVEIDLGDHILAHDVMNG